jgi:hypothetical protein
MSGEDIFGELDSRTKEPAGSDFADWWDPSQDDVGDTLVGIIVEMHSAPQEWTDAGEVPDTIYTVMSVGRGDFEEGEALTPKQHKQLKQGLKGAGLGDLVKLHFTGYQKVSGQPQPMMTYEVGRMPEDQWGELDGADDIKELLEAYNGVQGDNRRTEPYGTASDDGGSTPQASSPAGSSPEGQAAADLKELVDIQGGSVDMQTAERILNMKGHDVAVEDAALMAGLSVDDEGVSFPNER